MATLRPCLIVVATLLVLIGQTSGEIHRAKTVTQSKPRRPGGQHRPAPVQPTPGDGVTGSDVGGLGGRDGSRGRDVGGHGGETWVYSLVSAALVGLSGIFPLLVIPVDGTEALRGGGSRGLRQLLSFAVGGLLGDVFLHLLPEAWAHCSTGEDHAAVGLWVIAGLVAFMLVEKMFPDDDSEQLEELDSEGQTLDSVLQSRGAVKQCSAGEGLQAGDRLYGDDPPTHRPSQPATNGSAKHCSHEGFHGMTNGVPKHLTNGSSKRTSNSGSKQSANGDPKSTGCRTHASGGAPRPHTGIKVRPLSGAPQDSGRSYSGTGTSHGLSVPSSVQLESLTSRIKTSGWLNLAANMVDNFTHGLAVAGSYSVSTRTGMLTTAAILLHEVPHEIGDFAILLRSGFDRWRAAKAQLLTATGGVCGAFVALCAESTQQAGDRSAWILPFTSGGFIYIAMVTVLPDLLRDNSLKDSVKQMLLLLLGIAVMAAVTLLD